MSKKVTVLALSAMLFALSFFAEAQQPAKAFRIGYLSGSNFDAREEAFRQGLRDLGYIEGQNIVIEWRFAKGEEDRLAALAGELAHLKVDVIVTDGTRVTRAAKNAAQSIPIVMASDGDPVGTGHVVSLARPGGNITGLTNIHPGLSGKRLEVLKETLPGMSRVGVIWNSQNPQSLAGFKETQSAAGALGVQVESQEVRDRADFERVFQAFVKSRARAVTVLSDSVMFSHRRPLVELAAKHKLPTMHTQSGWVETGGLMSYGTHFPNSWRRAATYVDKILKGAKPADLPVEQPTKFEFVVNLKTAKQIGLKIPPNVLARADRVIR
jgi:putative ABC transport system substrate-binding protein